MDCQTPGLFANQAMNRSARISRVLMAESFTRTRLSLTFRRHRADLGSLNRLGWGLKW